MRSYKKLSKLLITPLLLVLPVFLSVGTAAASTYGTGGYSDCQYETDCPAPGGGDNNPPPGDGGGPSEPTLPSGLKVAINLTDGQHIPDTGYTITVTPLNGQGTTFKQVEISINDQLEATEQPESDGSASWLWIPAQIPGTKVSVVVTDQNDQVKTYTYNVVIDHVTNNGGGTGGTTSGSNSNSGGYPHRSFLGTLAHPLELPGRLTATLKHFVQNLPEPVIYSLPYTIFLILAANALVLLLQTKREIAEKLNLDELIKHEQAVNAAKANLIELVSHYLRTPLTLIRSGAEMLKAPVVPPETITNLQATIKNFAAAVEATVSTDLDPLVNAASPVIQPVSLRSRTAVIRLWLPLVLGGGFVFAFVYLANHATTYSAGTTNEIIQLATYSLIVFSSYQLFRRVSLRRRDNAYARNILAEQQIIDETRDKVINEASVTLQTELTKLSAVTATLPTGNDTKFIAKGEAQLKDLTNRLIIASHLKGSHSTLAYSAVDASTLYNRALQKVGPKAEAAGVSIELQQDTHLTTQNPDLLALVLQSVMDNAVAYSPKDSKVSVAATTSKHLNHLDVTDHGNGIEASKLSQLFQPFFKAEGAEEFNHEGMGFSLYLDKLIMLYLGGDITIESTPNQATTAHLSWTAS